MEYLDLYSLLLGLNMWLNVAIFHIQSQSSMSQLNQFPLLTLTNSVQSYESI